jgi:uncharacterized protein (TIGR03083 family)
MDENELETQWALLALDALDTVERSDANPLSNDESIDMQCAAAALGELASAEPPTDLRADTLHEALDRRQAGASIDAVAPCASVDAYRRAVDDLHELLQSLTGPDWDAVAHHEYGTVRRVVAHLVGIERICLSWVGARPAVDADAVADHGASTLAAMDEFEHVDPLVVVEKWYATAREVEEASRSAESTAPVLAHDLPTNVDGLLLLRTFELFAHHFDIAVATGRPRPTLDPPRLSLMSSRLMGALPFAIALSGTTAPGRTARIVVTGPAGGCYDVPLDPAQGAGTPDVTVVTDGTDICLLAARRLSPDDIEATIEGDGQLAGLVLAATGAFARD